ncbi:hypothetical protein CVT25_015920 [Psilocybe cyanescens]|uniref:Insertion element IS150 protein InsJ-like helix-turn-helix domain-containing protein n=1 Tax=Psilocybe cyanescens TaxID=93625 RepID=A0A409XRF1_PSICY|nr:hypothetical protein CVT25_015920 [Psilocybe cyanescens]
MAPFPSSLNLPRSTSESRFCVLLWCTAPSPQDHLGLFFHWKDVQIGNAGGDSEVRTIGDVVPDSRKPTHGSKKLYSIELLHMTSPKTGYCQLPSETKNKLIGAVDAGESIAQAARRYKVNEDTARSIIKKYKATESTENLPRSGHPQKLTETAKHHIIRTAQKQCRVPFGEISNQLGLDVSEQTIQKLLQHEGYH